MMSRNSLLKTGLEISFQDIINKSKDPTIGRFMSEGKTIQVQTQAEVKLLREALMLVDRAHIPTFRRTRS